MVKAKLSDKMIKILKDTVGKTFCSYECGNIAMGAVYGNVQINMDNCAIEIVNEAKELPFYDSTEDISHFVCRKKLLNEPFKPYCEEKSEKHTINENVISVSIIEDSVSVNDGESDIAFDMAVVIKTDKHSYMFSRGWFFSEIIDISVDKEFNEIYPINRVVKDWSEDGENKVDVSRNVRKL